MTPFTRALAHFARAALLVLPAASALAADPSPPSPPPQAPTPPETTLDRARALEIVAGVRRIATPEGIDELRQVELGGVKQWISIRGRNRANPVLLVLHGGPGTPLLPFAWSFQSPWEDFFTVVQWEQRGAGKNADGPMPAALQASLTVDRVVGDAAELVDQLRARFGKDKVAVLGFSWGTIVGTHLVKRIPDKVSVYAGVGQFVRLDAEADVYSETLAAARRAGDADAVAALQALAPYPDPDPDSEAGFRKAGEVRSIAVKYGLWYGHSDFQLMYSVPLLAPEYTAANLAAWQDAEGRVGSTLFADLQRRRENLQSLGPEFRVPMVFLMGRYDLFTPYVTARRYFDSIRAPSKKFVSFERSAHFVMLEEPGRFLQALLQEVLPHTEGSPAPAPLVR